MQLSIVGVSHKTAPVEIRERLAFPSDGVQSALSSLVQRERIAEAMILSTCNRVEIVAEGPDDRPIRDFLCEYHRIPAAAVSSHLYSYRNTDAIRHVFRVTSSLDSMMIGEPQILGQVKEAFRIATNAGTIGMHLSALMTRAFAVAKKVNVLRLSCHPKVLVHNELPAARLRCGSRAQRRMGAALKTMV